MTSRRTGAEISRCRGHPSFLIASCSAYQASSRGISAFLFLFWKGNLLLQLKPFFTSVSSEEAVQPGTAVIQACPFSATSASNSKRAPKPVIYGPHDSYDARAGEMSQDSIHHAAQKRKGRPERRPTAYLQ